MTRLGDGFFRAVKGTVLACAGVAGLGIVIMMLITCADVVLRLFRRPIPGALDLVMLCGGVTMAAALPYTTAVKGHVAIEFLVHKLSRGGRRVVTILVNLLGIAFFTLLAWQGVAYGRYFYENEQVTPTIQIRVFWLPLVMAFCCVLVALVLLHDTLRPGKGMVKP